MENEYIRVQQSSKKGRINRKIKVEHITDYGISIEILQAEKNTWIVLYTLLWPMAAATVYITLLLSNSVSEGLFS